MSVPKRLATSPSPLPGCLVRENNSFSHPLQAYEVLIWFFYSIFSLFSAMKEAFNESFGILDCLLLENGKFPDFTDRKLSAL